MGRRIARVADDHDGELEPLGHVHGHDLDRALGEGPGLALAGPAVAEGRDIVQELPHPDDVALPGIGE